MGGVEDGAFLVLCVCTLAAAMRSCLPRVSACFSVSSVYNAFQNRSLTKLFSILILAVKAERLKLIFKNCLIFMLIENV